MHDFHGKFSDLLHATNLRHGTDGFTSPPKVGVLRIFSPLKIRRLRPVLNPRTWVLKASTLPLDHRWSPKIGVVLHVNPKVDMIAAREEDKLALKQSVAKSDSGGTRRGKRLEAKSE
jgi:hypothetical protein